MDVDKFLYDEKACPSDRRHFPAANFLKAAINRLRIGSFSKSTMLDDFLLKGDVQIKGVEFAKAGLKSALDRPVH